MKKALLLVCILSISVITTACINNLAVQELNNKAAVFMEKGNYAEAIERLKSSIDLDDTLFESHYNLAIAYTKNGDYVNAVNSYHNAIKRRKTSLQIFLRDTLKQMRAETLHLYRKKKMKRLHKLNSHRLKPQRLMQIN